LLQRKNAAVFVNVVVLLLFVVSHGAAQSAPAGEPAVAPQSAVVAQEAPMQRPSLKTTIMPTFEVTLDGLLSEAAWSDAESITDLVTIEPQEGGVPAGKTVVKVLANATDLVIGVLANDPDPSGITSFSKARDSELDDEDHVLIVLDTFLDGRSGYVFAVNPSGTRFDGIVSAQGTDVNSNWDAVWDARTATDASGWSAEIRIPIKSLGFQGGLSTWGMNIERRVQRLQETSRWSGATQDYEIYQTSRAGLLTNLPNFDLGKGLSIRPAIHAGGEKSAGEDSTFTRDISLDVTQKLGANLLGSLTVNTDFAETEVDARETNLTRFEILFPEKRAFFLEGADIFEFGLGLDEVMIPFFSRRIGLGEDGIEIPINAGGKLNGRIGNTNVGALVVNTRHVDALDAGEATMGVMRVKQNIFAESSVGILATSGDQLGRANSWMTGADFTYQTSRFRGDKNLTATVWGMWNDREDLEGEKRAYGFGLDYPNDRYNFKLAAARLGDGFDPSLGFVPRTGVHISNGSFAFEPRPEGTFVRQMSHDVSVLHVSDLDFQWESYDVQVKPFDWQFESGERFRFSFSREGDRPEEEFSVFEGEDTEIIVPVGLYEWRRYRVSGSSAEKRTLTGEVTFETGGYYGGDLDTLELAVALKRSLFRLELAAERNMGTFEDETFTQNLYSGRVELKFSPNLQLSSLVQYDNESNSMGSNTRMRWTFSPAGDLFLVYNHNLQRSLSDRETRRWNYESNALILKVQYAWRP
jgi:uncharacterized cupredoxin-like copper-binding protein